MARPERNTVDYYPHIVGEGKKMFFIEKKYGNDGYATWHKILEKICSTEYHFLNLNKEEEVMYLAAKCNVGEDVLLCIINDLTKLEVFDKELWDCRIIWCQQLIDSVDDAYYRRNNDCITLLGLRTLLTSLGILKPLLKVENNVDNTQSRVEYTKVDKSRLFTPPTLEEVELFFKEKGYTAYSAKKAWNHYDLAGWKDTNGKPVKIWKQKMNSVWFKPENEIPSEPINVDVSIVERELYGSDTRQVKSAF